VRILARVHLYPPEHCAGAEMMLHTMLRALADRGHRIDVSLSRKLSTEPAYVLDGIRVQPGDQQIPTAAYDVVVSHLENVPHAGVKAAQAGVPFVQVVHNTFGITARLLHGAHALVVYNSEWMANELGRRDDAIIVRPPVLTADYVTTPGEKVTLINLNEEKGGALLDQIAGAMPDVQFLAVEGAYGVQLVSDHPNVEFRPHGGSMRWVYGSTRLLLMPSAYESWGRVGVEAMASGIPVIAHPTPGLRESLGSAGIFADRSDLDAWVTAIRSYLQPDAWASASAAALDRSAELDPTDDLARWVQAIENLQGDLDGHVHAGLQRHWPDAAL
jgi:hypothetical protein